MNYFDELCVAMEMLAEDPSVIFVGQGVGCAGTSLTDTLKGVQPDRLLEFPVAEDFQAGFCTGLALDGLLPVCIYPRWNFLLCAANQIINHLDKLPLFSDYRPKVIIRTAIAAESPLNPGPQHVGDFSEAFRLMLKTIEVVPLPRAETIVPAYRYAMAREGSTILVESTAAYYNVVPSGVPER